MLKGAALAPLYYQQPGVRGMSDFDVLVPVSEMSAAVELLLGTGWAAKFPRPELFDSRFYHGISFYDSNENSADLHCHAFLPNGGEDVARSFWDHSVPLRIGDCATRTLCPTDHLIHVCVHGLRWSGGPILLWIPDALAILRVAGKSIDWTRLESLSARCGVTPQMSTALAYLKKGFGISIPVDVIGRLSQAPVSKASRGIFRFGSLDRQTNPIREIQFRWSIFSHGIGEGSLVEHAVMLPVFLKGWLQTNRLWKVPFVLAAKVFRYLGKGLRAQSRQPS